MIPDFHRFWDNFHAYMEARHANGSTEEAVLAPVQKTLEYDIEAWIADGMPLDSSSYRLDEPELFEFRIEADNERPLANALQVWGVSLKGLVRLMKRMRVQWLERECIAVSHPEVISQLRSARQSQPERAVAAIA
jgi:hypothetical protein